MHSLLQNEKECYITHSTLDLHKHHIFMGPFRNKSEKYGCWVWLRADWHNMSNYGVHFNQPLDQYLKKEAQKAFEDKYSHEEFMKIFRKNYL